MADTLTDALTGLNYTPADTGFGMAQQSLSAMTPQVITPYTSTGRAVGIGLGSILLQSLLGYQARQQAAQDTLAVNTLANQLQTLETPQARTNFIKGVEDTGYQSRLSNLATALTEQDMARKLKRSSVLDELTTKGEFELGPIGTKLFERESQKQLEAQKAVTDRVLEAERLRQAGKPDTTDSETAKLRREFNMRPEVKGFSKLRDAATVIQLAEQDPSAVSSVELAKRAIHLLEPGLAAMQGEVEALQRSTSIPGQLKATLQQALFGEGGLDEKTRKGIIDMGKRAYSVAANTFEETRKFYEDEAAAAGLDPARIVSFGPVKPFEQLTQTTQPATTTNIEQDIAKLEAVLINPKVSEATKAAAQAKINELLGE